MERGKERISTEAAHQTDVMADARNDALVLGRRIREVRTARGMTLASVAASLGRATSHLSLIENGKRPVRITELNHIASVLDVPVADLLDGAPTTSRARLEVALEQVQRGPLFASLDLRPLALRKHLSDQAIETILALHAALDRVYRDRAATPEEARRANTALRREMRLKNNHFADLEDVAAGLLRSVGHQAGPLSQRIAADLAGHLGFTIHHVSDLPQTTRTVIDRKHGRVYLPVRGEAGHDPRNALLQALAGVVLGHEAPRDYAEFLTQRVRTNYLAGALLVPKESASALLLGAKSRRELSIEDLRDAFGVTYETAAHRFTNLATDVLGIPVHFLKVNEEGAISKAYENDDVLFPADALGAVEGQTVCRYWSARTVFAVTDRFTPYHQLTDKPNGTYWCTSSIQQTSRGSYSISIGTSFDQTKWFRGRDTTVRFASTCPDEACCRTPPAELSQRWSTGALPTPRVNSSLFATMPTGAFPGVDEREVYEFLENHAGA